MSIYIYMYIKINFTDYYSKLSAFLESERESIEKEGSTGK